MLIILFVVEFSIFYALVSSLKGSHSPDDQEASLPKVFLWGESKSNINHSLSDYRGAGRGIWSTMFNHQLYIKELLYKCNGVTHHLVHKASKADMALCSDISHGTTVHKNKENLHRFTAFA